MRIYVKTEGRTLRIVNADTEEVVENVQRVSMHFVPGNAIVTGELYTDAMQPISVEVVRAEVDKPTAYREPLPGPEPKKKG